MRQITRYIAIFLIFHCKSIFAADLPFTDISSTGPYYQSVKSLYENGVISDDGTHLFHPTDNITRDVFATLSSAVKCKKCSSPSIQDILAYQTPSFTDVPRSNPNYYCIEYARATNIIQGYPIYSGKKTYCEDGTSYETSPFCTKNTISRIEGVATLLKNANLWDDQKNDMNTDASVRIPDTVGYWYGYAKKGIEAGLLVQGADGSIKPSEKISRGEFAIMTAKILKYAQCNLNYTKNMIGSAIQLTHPNGSLVLQNALEAMSDIRANAMTEGGNWEYHWDIISPLTGEHIVGNNTTFLLKNLPEGYWILNLDTIDPATKKKMSNATIGVNIGKVPGIYHGDILIRNMGSETIDSNILDVGKSYTLNTLDSKPGVSSIWEVRNIENDTLLYATGETFTLSDLKSGFWMITLIRKDLITGSTLSMSKRDIRVKSPLLPPLYSTGISGGMIQASSITGMPAKVIEFTGSNNDSDHTIQYYWDFGDGNTKTSSSRFASHTYVTPGTYTVSLTSLDTVTDRSSIASMSIRITDENDGDGDGLRDSDDICPLVYGKPNQKGCPIFTVWKSQPYLEKSLLTNNQCIQRKKQQVGLMIGNAVCNICPCNNSVTVLVTIQACDVLFPAILSPDQRSIYSRGSLYIVP